MARVKFDKFECEDIRTDYLEFDAEHKAPDALIPSRTIVEFDSSTDKLIEKLNGKAADIDNVSVFMLAEDVLPSHYGIVYFIIERTDNLE